MRVVPRSIVFMASSLIWGRSFFNAADKAVAAQVHCYFVALARYIIFFIHIFEILEVKTNGLRQNTESA